MTSEDSIKYMTTFMHSAFVAMEPQTGAVKAWVGDIDFDHWKYDKVTAERQPGSTFKLFVYTEAMNQGLTPCDKRRDEYISMEVYDKKKHEMTTWRPSNANGSFSGDSIPLKSAFAKSINSVAVRLGQEMGIKRIIETAQKMGINSPLDDTPALALGSSDVNLLEMACAYSTISNNGKHHDPVLVTKIVDHDGKVVYEGPSTEEQVIPYKSAFLMQQLLQGGMKEPGGTSQSLWGYVGNYRDTEFGGKTGTTNNHSDAWFMCVSPKTGGWCLGRRRIPLSPLPHRSLGSGFPNSIANMRLLHAVCIRRSCLPAVSRQVRQATGWRHYTRYVYLRKLCTKTKGRYHPCG